MGYKENKELYEKYAPWLTLQAKACAPEGVDYRDILNEAFLKIARAYRKKGFPDERAVLSWMRRILANEAINEWRHHQKFQRMSFSEPPSLLNAEEPSEEQGTDGPSPEELAPLLLQLPPRQRLVLSLRYFGGLQHDEIAHKLGIATSTSTSLLVHAKRALRELLAEYLKKNER